MGVSEHYRHELKYGIDYAQYLPIRQRIRSIMAPDGHVGADGRYRIRSIYFDNLKDKALREKIDGVAKREKFRIRYYNDDFSYITLEKKIKDGNLCLKIDAPLTKKEYDALLAGECLWMTCHPSPLVRELYAKMKYQLLRPRVMVSYLREPYIYRAGNVRITFDSDIRTSLYHQNFLDERHDICAADVPQTMILEVKYDNFLPDVIAHLIQMDGVRQQAFSKYAVCRRFG